MQVLKRVLSISVFSLVFFYILLLAAAGILFRFSSIIKTDTGSEKTMFISGRTLGFTFLQLCKTEVFLFPKHLR